MSRPPDGIVPLVDALDAADFLEAIGRSVPRGKWVDDMIAAANQRSFENLM